MSYALIVEQIFAAAHAIGLADGTLEPTHGHNWTVRLMVVSRELNAIETVMDFHELQKMLDGVLRPVCNSNLNDHPRFAIGGQFHPGGHAWNPTAERVAQWIAQEIGPNLPGHVMLSEVRVSEAPGCVAIYRPAPEG
ncbi:MAG: 6-carboxytetrahydropterin synthase [Phycisphaeraceae bacterium]|nr:6-carboxytetrahydropterin synthase [Phycisphaeraceae bacterium]